MKDRKEFNKKYMENLMQAQKSVIQNFVIKPEEKFNKNIEKISLEEWIYWFKSNHVSMMYYGSIKSLLNQYFNELIQTGEIENQKFIVDSIYHKDVQNTGKYRVSYFKNIDDIHKMIREFNDEQDSLFRAAILLSFYGLTYEEMVALEKNNIKHGQIILNERNVEIDSETSKMLKSYINNSDNIYFFENRRNRNEEKGVAVSPKHIQASVSKTNAKLSFPIESEYYGKKILPQDIMRSGGFYHFTQYLIDQDRDLEAIRQSDLLDAPEEIKLRRSYSTYKLYLGWLEYFYDIKQK